MFCASCAEALSRFCNCSLCPCLFTGLCESRVTACSPQCWKKKKCHVYWNTVGKTVLERCSLTWLLHQPNLKGENVFGSTVVVMVLLLGYRGLIKGLLHSRQTYCTPLFPRHCYSSTMNQFLARPSHHVSDNSVGCADAIRN